MNKITSFDRFVAMIMAGCFLTAGSIFSVNLSHYHTPLYKEGKLIPWYSDENGPFDGVPPTEPN